MKLLLDNFILTEFVEGNDFIETSNLIVYCFCLSYPSVINS